MDIDFDISEDSSSDSDVSSEEIPAKPAHTETDHKCSCKAKLLLIEDGSFHTNSTYCNICDRSITKNETFFHCPQGSNTYHPPGFDCCAKCLLTGRFRDEKKQRKKDKKIAREKKRDSSRTLNTRVRASTTAVQSTVKAALMTIGGKQDEVNKPMYHKNYMDTANSRTTVESSKERNRLQKETEAQSKEIARLKAQLAAAQKEKQQSEATLKSVKTQVTNLILKNEELEKQAKNRGGHSKSKPKEGTTIIMPSNNTAGDAESKVALKEMKKSTKKMQKKIDKHDKQMKKMEKVVSSMYQLFSTRFEEISANVSLMENRINAITKTQPSLNTETPTVDVPDEDKAPSAPAAAATVSPKALKKPAFKKSNTKVLFADSDDESDDFIANRKPSKSSEDVNNESDERSDSNDSSRTKDDTIDNDDDDDDDDVNDDEIDDIGDKHNEPDFHTITDPLAM